MADEIKVTTRIVVTNGNFKRSISPATGSFTQDAVGAYHNTVDVGTSEENIGTFGDIATEGWCYLKNLDTTNYIQVGFSTGVYGIRLEAGESAMFRCEPALTLYLKANTAECILEVFVAED